MDEPGKKSEFPHANKQDFTGITPPSDGPDKKHTRVDSLQNKAEVCCLEVAELRDSTSTCSAAYCQQRFISIPLSWTILVLATFLLKGEALQ